VIGARKGGGKGIKGTIGSSSKIRDAS